MAPDESRLKRGKRSSIAGAVLVLLLTVGALYFSRDYRPSGPTMVIFPFSPRVPNHPVPIPDRWIPRNWGWLWRTKEMVLGRRKTVTLDGKVISLPSQNPAARELAILSRTPDLAEGGTKIWLLSTNELADLRNEIGSVSNSVLTAGRITMGEKSEGMLASTQPLSAGFGRMVSAGLSFNVYPVLHKHSTTVWLALAYSQFVTNGEMISVQTNLALNGRFELPHGSGIIILKAEPGSDRLGFLLVPGLRTDR